MGTTNLVLTTILVANTNMKSVIIACRRQDNTGVVGAVFSHEFEAENGIIQAKAGSEGSAGQSNMAGSFSVPLDDGSLGTITYVADENGYQPVSDLLPVAPELPAHVVEMLAFVAQQQASGLVWDQDAGAWV